MYKYLVAIFLSIIFTSCQTTVDLSLNQIDKQFKDDSLHFERTIKIKNGAKDSTIVSTLDYIFPVFKDTALSWVNNFIIHKLISASYSGSNKNNSLKDVAKLFLDDFESYSKEGRFVTEWYLDASGSALYYNDSILKLSFGLEEYSGGLHPSHNCEYYILDIKNRKQLTLLDFLNSPQDTIAVRKAAIKELRKMKNLTARQKLDDDGGMFINDQTFYTSKHFDIDSANVTFFYNEYEIQPYVYGYTEIIIPKVKLRKQLKSKFLN